MLLSNKSGHGKGAIEKVDFIHLRVRDPEGIIQGKGGVTIAFKFDEHDGANVSFARCHTNDRFCKKVGRHIAENRLTKPGEFSYLTPQELADDYERIIIDEVLEEIEVDWPDCRDYYTR